jgi:hypothetical protein
MDDGKLVLRSAFERFLEALPLHELGIAPDQLRAGLDEMYAQLLRVGLDAFHARQSGIPFHAAANDGENYPHLRRFHLAATDMLQLPLPSELVPWFERFMRSPVPPVAAELQNLIARSAVDASAAPVERAFLQFLLYQGARLNLVVAAWRNDHEFASAGARMADVDRIAHDELEWLLANAAKLGPEDRPLHVLVALGMERLNRHVAELLRELRAIMDDVTEAQKLRAVFEAKVEAYIRDMNLTDAVLIRNRVAPELGEQRVPVEVLQAEHPLALEGMSRAAMDQRVKRLVDHLGETRGLPARRAPALIDLIDQRLLDEQTEES